MKVGKWILLACVLLLIGAVNFFFVSNQDNLQLKLMEEIHFVTLPLAEHQYDVIVIGGEPEGVAAAVSSARNGLKTLLVDSRDGLGGLFTFGYLNQLDIGYDHKGRIANQGIFTEWYDLIGRVGNFDVPLAKNAFLHMVMNEENITLLLNTELLEVEMNGQALEGVVLETPHGVEHVRALRFIDTTASADLAVLAGAPYTKGQEDMGRPDAMMAVTLVMLFENVDWNQMSRAAKQGVLGGAEVYKNIAWGFNQVPLVYTAREENTRVRGLNVGMQSDGLVSINALQIFGVDGTDPDSVAEGIERGKRETEYFLTFLQEHLPGFEEARIAYFPSELYIRETRHILAEYQVTIIDVWENRDQWDSIGLGAYPVDVQATDVTGFGNIIVSPEQYAIPFRSLVPLDVDNLLVASKASGYTSLAAGSARTVPIGMSAAQAAGAASALSIEHNLSFRELTKNEELIKTLQSLLVDQGALIYPFDLPYPYQGEWFYPYIKAILPYGILQAGYDNSLKVEEVMSEKEFLRLFSGLMIRHSLSKHEKYAQNFNIWHASTQTSLETPLTRDIAISYLLRYFGISFIEGQEWITAIDHQLIAPELITRLNTQQELTRAESFALIGYLVHLLDRDHL